MPSLTDNPATAAAKWWCPRHVAVTIEGLETPRRDLVITKPFARLGRDERSEVELPDASVLPCHVYLHATNDGLYCTGLAAGSLNGWLAPSATLEVGPFRVRASLVDIRPADGPPDPPGALDPQSKGSAGPHVARIRMYTDKSRSSHADIVLQRQLTLIGRQAPATWRIKHPTISRAHGAVVWDGVELWLIDFFSSNGTRLGDRRCDADMVRPGQEFRIGTVTCSYLDMQRASEQVPGAGDSSDSRSPGDDPTRERRVDAPQRQAAPVVPPHATPGGSGRVVRASSPDLTPISSSSDRALPEAAPAALVETRPLAGGDTKFVDRPQRSPEDRLAAAEAELAAHREQSAARAARVDSELVAIRQELERLATTLRNERESERDHRAQVAELRERVLRELAQIGEQTQLVRQACDLRPWETSVARLAEDVVRRCSELERQLKEGLRSAASEVASVEGTMIAKVAELRSRQDRLEGERPAVGSDDPESVLSVEPLEEEWPSEDQPSRDSLPARGEPLSAAKLAGGPSTELTKRTEPSGRSAADESSQWLPREEFTHRLVDFQQKRRRSAWQRRLLWTGAAVISALAIVLSASLLRLWFDKDRAAQSGKASPPQAQKSKPNEHD